MRFEPQTSATKVIFQNWFNDLLERKDALDIWDGSVAFGVLANGVVESVVESTIRLSNCRIVEENQAISRRTVQV